MKTTVNNNNIESKKATREAASKNNRKALCDELCTLLGYKAWEIKKDACTGKFAGSYDYSMKFEDGKELYICTRKDLFETNVSELIDGFKHTSKEGYKHGDMVKTKNSGRLAKVMRVGTVCEGYGTMLYLKEEGVAPKDNRFVEIHNLICSADEVEPLQPASEITEAEGVKIGDKVKHVWSDEVATVTAIRKAYWDASAGEVWLFTLDYGKDTKGDWKTVLGPFKMDLNGKEFRREAFTLYEPSEITEAEGVRIGSREWYREKLTGEWERETMYFEYFDVHHDSCVEVHKPTHNGTPTGDRWQTDITVWGDPTHDGTPRKEDAEPCVTFRTIDDLCKHLETLHVATMQLEDLTIDERNRLELERGDDRPTAWATDCTADDFEKLTSRYEVSDEDCDIVGRRFRFKPDDGLFNLSVFVADYAGNEAHALIYILDEFMGTVRANVLPIDKLRSILTEARGWQQAA